MALMKQAGAGYFLLVAKKKAKFRPSIRPVPPQRMQLAFAVEISSSCASVQQILQHTLVGCDITPDTWAHLPFTKAEDLAADPQGFLSIPPSEIPRIVSLPTSGTRLAKRIFLSEADLEATVNFFCHRHVWPCVKGRDGGSFHAGRPRLRRGPLETGA